MRTKKLLTMNTIKKETNETKLTKVTKQTNETKVTNETDDVEILEGRDENVSMNIKQLNILPYQVEHFKNVCDILRNELGYMDISLPGSGKTLIVLAIAITYKMSILLFCPKSVIPKWKREARMYGVNLVCAMTYNSLRGTAKTGVKSHPYLTRNGGKFTTTEAFIELAKKGLLICYDESHNLKNENDQLAAAAALSRSASNLAKTGVNVRIAALSGTPADKKENINCLFKILGIVTAENLFSYNRRNKTYNLEGLDEAIKKCKKYDPDTTYHILCKPVNKTTSKQICYDLYIKVLRNRMTSAMSAPPIDYKLDIKNLFVVLPEKDLERLRNASNLFCNATNYDKTLGEVKYSGMDWGMITQCRREIDSAKAPTICRWAENDLKTSNCKVVIYYTYKRDMYVSAELLKKYNPLIVNGDSNAINREEAIRKFQESNNDCRVFISNSKCGGVGIELDDLDGNFNRITYIAPSYHFLDQVQSCRRTYRLNTKSDCVVRFVYSLEISNEMNILNSMIQKSCVCRDLIKNDQNVVFPGELEAIYEKESYDSEGSED